MKGNHYFFMFAVSCFLITFGEICKLGIQLTQAFSHVVVWGGKCYPLATSFQLFATPGNLFAIFHWWFIFVAKERSPEILAELNLGLCIILESSVFACAYIIHLIVITWSMEQALKFLPHDSSKALKPRHSNLKRIGPKAEPWGIYICIF